MTPKPSACLEIADALLEAATGEAGSTTAARVDAHVSRCAPCRDEFVRYRAIDRAAARLREVVPPPGVAAEARRHLLERLADVRSRLVAYGVFASPLGPILIARSEQGIALIEYVRGASARPRLENCEAVEAPTEVEPFHRELLEYLQGRRTSLAWPLDFRGVRSRFHGAVLRTTAALPYGTVTSYTRIARLLGSPRATRAVAQALRRNPLPIVVPCHRVIGASGALTGYAGRRVELKGRLLEVEGVSLAKARRGPRVERAAMYARHREDTEYCLPTCGSLAGTSLADLTLFASRQCAEGCGLAPCSTCRPDLHPLPR